MKKLNITIAAAFIMMMTGMVLPGIVSARDLPGTGTTAQQLNLQKAKTILLDTIGRLETHFENTKAKAAALQKITEGSGMDIAQIIDDYLAQIADLKTQAQNARTAAQLKTVAQSVHNLIVNAKTDVKKNISQRVEVRIEKFTQNVDRTKPLIDLARKRINQLQTQGANTENVNKDLQDCEQLVKKGNENLQEARNKFRQFQELPRDQETRDGHLMNDGIKMVQNARATYSEARQNCSKVMRELRVLKD